MSPLRADDFFETVEATPPLYLETHTFRSDFALNLLAGKVEGISDLETADITVRLLHSELERYGTSGGNRIEEDDDLELLFRLARAACKRVGIELPRLAFRTFNGFYSFWKKQGMSGSYAARRNYLEDVFHPIEEGIDGLQLRALDESLAEPISPWQRTGWPTVDREISDLRQRFDAARSSQDYAAVGTACVRILEAIGDAAFEPEKHLLPGETVAPPRDKTKDRLGRVVQVELSGSESEEIRGLVNTAITVAHRVKHKATPSRREAGLAADAVILLANLVRRLVT
jgi:hypothetical protein